jgi:hypothetical protein
MRRLLLDLSGYDGAVCPLCRRIVIPAPEPPDFDDPELFLCPHALAAWCDIWECQPFVRPSADAALLASRQVEEYDDDGDGSLDDDEDDSDDDAVYSGSPWARGFPTLTREDLDPERDGWLLAEFWEPVEVEMASTPGPFGGTLLVVFAWPTSRLADAERTVLEVAQELRDVDPEAFSARWAPLPSWNRAGLASE